jgi:nicotinate-nucleotide pyrophosphorylase (carboxylating)
MTLKEFHIKYDTQISRAIHNALSEDRALFDISSNLLFRNFPGTKKTKAKLLCKEDCVLAGLGIFDKVYENLYDGVHFKRYFKEGEYIEKNSIVAEIQGPVIPLLQGERTALNFLQRMSGIATVTNKFVMLRKYRNSKILPTRKTTPNFRLFELLAVKLGGGDFHRFSLDSSVMVKDNHIVAAGSFEEVLKRIESAVLSKRLKHNFEVEVKSINELKLLLKNANGVIKIVMLDNFYPGMIVKAMNLVHGSGIKVEVSGGINLSNFNKYQHPDIDFYSIGMLTHSYKSIDFSLEFIDF